MQRYEAEGSYRSSRGEASPHTTLQVKTWCMPSGMEFDAHGFCTTSGSAPVLRHRNIISTGFFSFFFFFFFSLYPCTFSLDGLPSKTHSRRVTRESYTIAAGSCNAVAPDATHNDQHHRADRSSDRLKKLCDDNHNKCAAYARHSHGWPSSIYAGGTCSIYRSQRLGDRVCIGRYIFCSPGLFAI